MNKKMIIGFTFSTIFLVVFEYLLLQELYSQKRTGMMLAGIMGIVGAAAFFVFFFIQYRRKLDQS